MEFESRDRTVKNPLPVRVVLVKPEFQMNIGSVARVAKNFGVVDLAIVKPAPPFGPDARKYAMHSLEVLENAKHFDSLKDAVADCDVVIGTSGVVKRFENALKNTIDLRDAATRLAKKKPARVAVVFGSEGNGLSKEDTLYCDFMAFIPTNPAHPILNLSHAVAVTLYGLFYATKKKTTFSKKSTSRSVRSLEFIFDKLFEKANKRNHLRDSAKVKRAWRNVLHRSEISEEESMALMAVLSELVKVS